MHRIKAVCREVLAAKVADEATVPADDTHSKTDIMSLLLRARFAEKDPTIYKIDDAGMLNQMVRDSSIFLMIKVSNTGV